MRSRLVLVLFAIACSKSDTPPASDTPVDVSAAASAGVPVAQTSLTAADIDGFIKGIEEEARLVREGNLRASKAVTPVERGNAIQSTFEENTMTGAVPVSGLPLERYRMVRQTLSRLLTTLDFQGKIDGPQSVDTTMADSSMKARLASDPYSVLDSSTADLVKSRLDEISKAWIDYIQLTAVSG